MPGRVTGPALTQMGVALLAVLLAPFHVRRCMGEQLRRRSSRGAASGCMVWRWRHLGRVWRHRDVYYLILAMLRRMVPPLRSRWFAVAFVGTFAVP